MSLYEVHSQRLLDDGQRRETVSGFFGPYEDLTTAVRMAERQQEQGAVALQLLTLSEDRLIEQVYEGAELEALLEEHRRPLAPLGPRQRLSSLAAAPDTPAAASAAEPALEL